MTEIDEHKDVPDHDVLLGGFPCQPFSIAGVSKKNALGRKHGFEDPTQGTLFFDIKRIIDEKRPSAFLLENVKNLKSHDRGRTFEVIKTVLQDELGYRVQTRVVNGKHFTPQNRERILIVGFREENDFDIDSLVLPAMNHTVDQILHRKGEAVLPHDAGRYFDHRTGQVHEKYTLTQHLWNYLRAYADKHKSAGNGVRVRSGEAGDDDPHPVRALLQGRLGDPRGPVGNSSPPAHSARVRASWGSTTRS
nr:DNA (cytosine-5-)-methyltransferase [Nocardioides sp. B-3]